MSASKSDENLFQRLNELGIKAHTVEHAPLHTVEESQTLRGELAGAHIKNLFLRDKKKNMWLVTVEENRDVDLKGLRKVIGAKGNLSFGNADLLMEKMGVSPGSVSPFCVFSDSDNEVTMILDEGLLAADVINAHPLRNDRTTAIAANDLLAFLKAENHDPILIDFSKPFAIDENQG